MIEKIENISPELYNKNILKERDYIIWLE